MGARAADKAAVPRLEIRLLGRFTVLRDGTPIPDAEWKRRKNRTLLKVLAVDPGRTQSQDQLLEKLFAGENPQKALQNLHARISQIRRVLQPELKRGRDSPFIVGRGGGYSLETGAHVCLDTATFEHHLRNGQARQSEERWAEAASEFEGALAVYRGELLEEDRYAEWALAPREHFASLRIDCLMQLAECWARCGRLQKAIDACRKVLESQPHCESVYRQLMRYHCMAGEHGRALLDYEACEKVLDEYLGVEPDPQTQELYQRIKNRDPDLLARSASGHRIAVLPFHCTEDDADLASFVAGIGLNLVAQLSALESVWVSSWSDVRHHAAREQPLRDVAAALRVRYVLEGSIERAPNGYRVSARLVDAEEEKQLWVGRCERCPEAAEPVEIAVASVIAEGLGQRIPWLRRPLATEAQSQARPAPSPYEEGRALMQVRSADNLQRAVERFQEALASEGDAAPIWADLATAYAYQAVSGFRPQAEIEGPARTATEAALRLDPDAARSHLAAALVRWHVEGDLPGAEREFRAALAIDPEEADTVHGFASFLLRSGKLEEGVVLARQANALDPSMLSPDDGEIHARPWIRATEIPASGTVELAPAEIEGLRPFLPSHAIAKLFSIRETRGELKWLTFLFAEFDWTDGPSVAEEPERYAWVTQATLQGMVKTIAHYGGVTAQVRSQGICALFGVPRAHEDDVERAVRAALEIRRVIGQAATEKAMGNGSIAVRIGLDVGRALVESREEEASVPFLPVSEAAHVAARLEASAAPGEIVITDRVHRVVAPLLLVEPFPEKVDHQSTSRFRVVDVRPGVGKARGITGLSSPLVGRQGELRTLTEHVDLLARGRGHIVFLQGEAGMGKTRLLAELLRSPRCSEIPTVHVSCVSYEQGLPYHACRAIAQQCLSLISPEREDPAAQLVEASAKLFPSPAEGADLVPFLATLLGIEDAAHRITEALEPALVRRQLAQTMVHLVERTATSRPLLLVLDDVHWMDGESVRVIAELFAVSERAPVLFIIVHRPEHGAPLRKLIEAAAYDFGHRHLALHIDALPEDEERSFLTNLLSHCVLPEELYAFIVRKSEGNPLFAEEIVRLLIDERVLRQDESGRWYGIRAAEEPDIPPRLVGLLEARIDRLEPFSREILQLASVIGRVFGKTLLKKCVPEGAEVDRSILDLQQSGLIRETAGIPEQMFSFRHEMMMEAAYAGLPRSGRIEFHRRVADAMESSDGGRSSEAAAVLGDHLFDAEEWSRALEYLIPAAEHAWTRYKSSEAAALLSRAAEAADRCPDAEAPTRYAIRKQRSEVFALLGRADEERSDLEELQAIAEAIGATETTAEVHLLWSDFHYRSGDYRRAFEDADQAVALLRPSNDERLQLLAVLGRAQASMGLGKFKSARADLEDVADRLPRAAESAIEAEFHKLLGTAAARLNDFALAESSFEASRALYASLGDRQGEARILGNLGAMNYLLGRFEMAIEHTREAQRGLGIIGDQRGRATCLRNLGASHEALGDHLGAVPYHRAALELYRELRDAAGEAACLLNLGVAHTAMGAGGYPELVTSVLGPLPEFDEADRLLRQALEMQRAIEDRGEEAITSFDLGSNALCSGNLEDAARRMHRALDLSREMTLHRLTARSLAALARIHLLRDELPEALAQSADAVSLTEREKIPVAEEVYYTRFRVLQAAGKRREATACLDRAVDAVQERAAAIQSEEFRAAFLGYCRPILDARDVSHEAP